MGQNACQPHTIYQSVAACTLHPFAGDCPKGTAAAQRNAEAEPVCLDAHPQAELLNAVRCEDSYTRNEKHSMKYRSINWCSKISAVCNCSIIFSRKTDIFLYPGVIRLHMSMYFGSAQNHNHQPWEWRVVLQAAHGTCGCHWRQTAGAVSGTKLLAFFQV